MQNDKAILFLFHLSGNIFGNSCCFRYQTAMEKIKKSTTMAADSMTNEKKAETYPAINHLHVRTKTWIENDQQDLVFGKGKTEILELIEREGSIARAAVEMGLSYKKAWSHIKVLQKQIAENLVISQKGGVGSGGTQLTPRAIDLMKKYRQLQEDVEAFANHRFSELFLSDSSQK